MVVKALNLMVKDAWSSLMKLTLGGSIMMGKTGILSKYFTFLDTSKEGR